MVSLIHYAAGPDSALVVVNALAGKDMVDLDEHCMMPIMSEHCDSLRSDTAFVLRDKEES